MIPDRTHLGTLYIKTDDGEYQELGKTTSVEYTCDVASLPTLNLELRCTYEQNKKEKEVKEMSYDELVKNLPKIEIDGVPIEYGKTKVIYTYNNKDYEGLIVYNDDSDMLNLLFLSDTKCWDFNDALDTVSNEVENTLNFIFNEKNFEHRNQWVEINDLKLAPKKTDIHITTSSGLKIDTTGPTTISSSVYEPFNYVSYDTSMTKDYYDRYCLGMWNTEEKKERGNKMELINIYKEKSLENIKEFYQKKITKYRNSNELKKQYDAIINEANEKLCKLFETQDLTKRNLYTLTNEESLSGIKYHISTNGRDDIIDDIYEQEKTENNALFEKLTEVNAQIECIEDHSENEYEEIMRVLKDYGIVDEKGKVTPINIKPRHDFDDGVENRRGRKPSKKSE